MIRSSSSPPERPLVRTLALLGPIALVALQAACPGSLTDAARFAETDAGANVVDGASPETADAPPACPDVPTEILTPSCGTSFCHGATAPAANLDLDSPGLAARLVSHPATGGAGLLVDPASPSASVLYTKLQEAPPYGSRMPLGGAPLDAASMACVLSWVGGLSASRETTEAGAGDASGAGDAGSDDGAGAWMPTSSTSTVLWLDARKNVTVSSGLVTAWGDLSSFSNGAAQSDTTTAPSLDATGVDGGPGIKFDETNGTFLSIADATSLQWGTGGYLIAIVGSNTKATAGRGHGGGVSTVFAKPQLQGAVEITVHFNYFTSENADDDSFFNAEEGEGEPGLTSTTKGYNDGALRLYVARVDTSSGSATMELRVNGVQVGLSSGNALVDVSLVGSPVRIGSTYGQSVEGEVAEVVAMRGAVGAADLASLEGYLMAKYGLQAEGGM